MESVTSLALITIASEAPVFLVLLGGLGFTLFAECFGVRELLVPRVLEDGSRRYVSSRNIPSREMWFKSRRMHC